MEALIEDRSIYYVDEGEGSALVFIAGTLSDHSLWAPVADSLENYRRIRLDLRDVGRSDPALHQYTAADLTKDVLAVMNAAKVETAVVIGHSLGGVVTQELAVLAPERCSGLILCSSWTKTELIHESIFKLWLSARTDLTYEHFLQFMFLCGVGRTLRKSTALSEFATAFAETTPMQSAEAFARQIAANLAVNTRARIEKISVPTLVVAGTEDFLFDETDQVYLAKGIPGAKSEFIAGAGHCPPIEQTEVFLAVIRPFLSAHAAWISCR